jgi:hypothetical protein
MASSETLEAIFVIGRQMQKSPGEMPGDFSFERPNTI